MDVPMWTELAALLVDVPVPEPTLRGAIRSFDGDDESRGRHGFFGRAGTPLPVFAWHGVGAPAPYRVWRDGLLVRMERPDGSPSLIVGSELCWQFHADGRVVASPLSALRYGGQGTDLIWHQAGERLFGPYARKPLGPVEATTFLGRPAWTVELGPPPGKAFHSRWVVDAETGILLQDHNTTLGSVDEWVELVVGEPLEPALFSYDGPSITEADAQAATMAQHERELAERREWLLANVVSLPLRVELASTVQLHAWDDETGAFEASLGEAGYGSLARRPRSDTEWDLRWHDVGHRWSDDRWDWALSLHQEQLTEAGLEALKRQLGR
ncbi:MAG: hypothetical protein QOJ11_2136 [Frankiales bacterium]|jgi:hypothetical protein|nr:hypothetical protein [Frankiales bacterium]